MKHFSATALLKSVAFAIRGEFILTLRGHWYILLIKERFPKLLKAIPINVKSTAEITKRFVDHWIFNYVPPKELLPDKGSQFTFKFFMNLCHILNTKKAFTTTYNPLTNGQSERWNWTIYASLGSYIEYNPWYFDLYNSTLTYGYNSQPQSST